MSINGLRWDGLIAFIVTITLVLVGCGGDSDGGTPGERLTATPQADAGANTSLFAGMAAPPADRLTLPAIAGMTGRLVFVQDGALYLAAFDGQPAQELAPLVGIGTLKLSPDRSQIAYSTGSDQGPNRLGATIEDYTVQVTDLNSLNTQSISADRGQWRSPIPIVNWSPDSRLLLFWSQRGLSLADLGDNDTLAVTGWYHGAWLTDGKVLVYGGEMPPDAGRDDPAIAQFDPASRELNPVDVPVANLAALDFLLLEPDLHAAGYVYDESFDDYRRAALLPDGARVFIAWPESMRTFAGEICQPWQIIQQPRDGSAPAEVIYADDAATFLSDLTALPDGSILFLQWMLEDCSFLGTMQVALIRLAPEAEPVVLTREVDPGTNGNPNDLNFIGYVRGQKYSVTPDGRYVFWIGRAPDSARAELRVTDLDTGDTAALLAATVLYGEGYIDSVLWVPGAEDSVAESADQ